MTEIKKTQLAPENMNRGETNGQAKLSDAEAQDIRTLYASGEYTQQQLANKYGIAKATVGDIVRGRRWASFGGPITKRNKEFAPTDQFKEEVILAYEGGISMRRIAEDFGTNRYTIEKIVKAHLGK